MSLPEIYLCELADDDLFSRFLEANLIDACKSLGRLLLLFCVRALTDKRDDDPLLPSLSRRDPGCSDGTSANAVLPETAKMGQNVCGMGSVEGREGKNSLYGNEDASTMEIDFGKTDGRK
ncbi:hypothetical protein ACLOJK_010037, partial [Asimina triloba]